MTTANEYDRFAWVYNKYWSNFSSQVVAVLQRILFTRIPDKANILDLCCGTGQLARKLGERGYFVTGIDSSSGMLRFAKENAPRARFFLADAVSFNLPPQFHAAISAFDSLNHVVGIEKLKKAFGNVHEALLPGGLFLFDLVMEKGFEANWLKSYSIVKEKDCIIVQSHYMPEKALARIEITVFHHADKWERTDYSFLQRCYAEEEVLDALKDKGFLVIETSDADLDLNLPGGYGRTFFLARKQAR